MQHWKRIYVLLTIACLAAGLAACGPIPPPATEAVIQIPATHQALATDVPAPTATSTSTPVPEDELDPDDLAAFDFVIEKKIETVPLAGLSLGIRWGESPAYVKGYGQASVEESIPTEATTVYRIASLTKQFTAAAIMQLVEQGKIDLDGPASAYLPELPAAWAGVKVRHLLNHTSGIPNYEGFSQSFPLEELPTYLESTALEFEPGSRFQYGNSGYLLLCAIIEQESGLACDEYIEQHILEPLALKATFNCLRSYEGIAQGYTLAGQDLQPVADMPSSLFGASGLCSTAGDLLLWQQALVEGRVVSAESYQAMISPTKLTDGTLLPYGFGIGIGEDAIGHGGGGVGFRSWLVYYPDVDLTIVLLSNTDVPASASLEVLADVIATRILGKPNE
jgi:D-alanyl-D-alanine carboxypeptidase